MNTILQKIAVFPGVIGSIIVMKDRKVEYSNINLPDVFTETMAIEGANSIISMTQMAEAKGLAPQSISIKYDKFDFLTMPVNETTLLLILCEPDINTALVATTACILIPELNELIEQQQKSDFTSPSGSSSNIRSIPEQSDNQKTEAVLNHIKKSLFETVGPFADFIYEECVERWTSNKPADISRISELLESFSNEMDNPQLFEEFKEKVIPFL